MTPGVPHFYPFFDPYRDGDTLRFPSKAAISLALGALFAGLHYSSLPNKPVFFVYNLWVLGAIIATSMLALYIAVEVFRRNLQVICTLEGKEPISEYMVRVWLNDRRYIITGTTFALFVAGSGIAFGFPDELRTSNASLALFILGQLMAGFASGMGLHGIVALIVLYLKFTPALQYSLDPANPAGIDGLKKLGDSLWFFAGLVACVGVLVLIYLFSIPWTNAYLGYVQALLVFWAALPFITAVSIVLIPGLAMRRQVSSYKSYMGSKLRSENAKLYSSYKKFQSADDDAIIAEKKQIGERLERIQEQMDRLRKMRDSHLD